MFDDLAGRMKVDETLVNLELVTIPGLRTFTTRLHGVALENEDVIRR